MILFAIVKFLVNFLVLSFEKIKRVSDQIDGRLPFSRLQFPLIFKFLEIAHKSALNLLILLFLSYRLQTMLLWRIIWGILLTERQIILCFVKVAFLFNIWRNIVHSFLFKWRNWFLSLVLFIWFVSFDFLSLRFHFSKKFIDIQLWKSLSTSHKKFTHYSSIYSKN